MKKDGRDWNIFIIQWMGWMAWMDEILHGFSHHICLVILIIIVFPIWIKSIHWVSLSGCGASCPHRPYRKVLLMVRTRYTRHSIRKKLAASSWRQRRLLKAPKRLASALTPRHAQSRTTTKSQAKPKPIRSTSFRKRIGPSEPPKRRGWDLYFRHPFTYISLTAFLFSIFLLISERKFCYLKSLPLG